MTPHRTEFFTHMTARPHDPESWRRPICAAVALVLVIVAVLMAAGCVNQTQEFPEGKFILLQQQTDINISDMTGAYNRGNIDYGYDHNFDENKRILTYYSLPYRDENFNESLRLFYSASGSENQVECCGNFGGFVYSTPRQFPSNVSIDAIREDGTVELRFHSTPVVLKPYERWENISHEVRRTEPFHTGMTGPDQPGEIIIPGCTENITITDRVYNAGFLEKRKPLSEKSSDASDNGSHNHCHGDLVHPAAGGGVRITAGKTHKNSGE